MSLKEWKNAELSRLLFERFGIAEKAKSKAQQRFMGMVHACKEEGDCPSEKVKKAADSMTGTEAEKYATTKHKGLPEKVKEGGRAVGESWDDPYDEDDPEMDALEREFPWMAKKVTTGEVPPEVAAQIAHELGEVPEEEEEELEEMTTVGGGALQGAPGAPKRRKNDDEEEKLEESIRARMREPCP